MPGRTPFGTPLARVHNVMEQDFPVKDAGLRLRKKYLSNAVSPDGNHQHLSVALDRTNFFLLDSSVIIEAERFIEACESCCDSAEISFDYLLDAMTGCDPSITEYVMSHPAKCSRCGHEVTEKTLVVPA